MNPPLGDVSYPLEKVALGFRIESYWMCFWPGRRPLAVIETCSISTATPIPTGSPNGMGPLTGMEGVLPINLQLRAVLNTEDA